MGAVEPESGSCVDGVRNLQRPDARPHERCLHKNIAIDCLCLNKQTIGYEVANVPIVMKSALRILIRPSAVDEASNWVDKNFCE